MLTFIVSSHRIKKVLQKRSEGGKMFESKNDEIQVKRGIVAGILACCGIIALGMFAIVNLPQGSDSVILIIRCVSNQYFAAICLFFLF